MRIILTILKIFWDLSTGLAFMSITRQVFSNEHSIAMCVFDTAENELAKVSEAAVVMSAAALGP